LVKTNKQTKQKVNKMKKNSNSNKVYRQGDVLICRVDKIPDGLIKTKRVTLAFGEVTGHHHTIESGAVGYAEKDENGLASFFEVTKDVATLTHQEHEAIELPKGTYESSIQVEYTPQAIRRVAD
jgi:hypothetical protein